jgi:hypothetical protein
MTPVGTLRHLRGGDGMDFCLLVVHVVHPIGSE